MVDVIVFLCKEENLSCPSSALKASIANVLPKVHGLVVHLEPSSRYFIIYLIIYTFSSLLQYFIMLGMIW
jgi:hypothetical protein